VTRPLRLSVVVPANGAPEDLEACLAALAASNLARAEWELIVVDDATPADLAQASGRHANIVIPIDAPKKGPAFARNRGVERAMAAIVAFVDADVEVHTSALRQLVEALEFDPTVSAVFGSYDDEPLHPGLVSQYRNLLHHYVHQGNGGDANTFWAGCGAVRRNVFEAVGMFDENRYRRPEIEDVELGYRLRDAGHRIILDPRILCTHRKRWSLGGMVKSDFSRRGVPWTRLLLERGMLLSPRGLSLGAVERVSAVSAAAAVVFAVAAPILRQPLLILAALVALGLFVVANRALFKWLVRSRGLWFAVRSADLHFLYSVVAAAALIWGTAAYSVPSRRCSS